jgi:RNA polymerase sigma factor (sigma-70 family)
MEPTPEDNLNEYLPEVYEELRKVAHRFCSRLKGGTIDPTELVHDVFCKFKSNGHVRFRNEIELLKVATSAIWRAIIDHERRRRARRGGLGENMRVDFNAHEITGHTKEAEMVFFDRTVELLALADAMDELELVMPDRIQLLMLHWFCGWSFERIGAAHQQSEAWARNRTNVALAWLKRRLEKEHCDARRLL